MTPANSSHARHEDEAGVDEISIDLSQEQIDLVAQEILLQGRLPGLLGALQAPEQALATWEQSTMLEDRRLSRSVLLGLLILASIATHDEGRRLIDVSEQLNLPPSSTHRYIKTLMAVGLLEQIDGTHRYRVPLSVNS